MRFEMLNTAFSPWPSFSDEEADDVAATLRSNRVNYWTGTAGRSFETEFATWTGSSRAIALANGTLALDLALRALGIGPGDEVIVTPRTFIASISCVVTAGATPIFVDVDRDSGNIHPASIAAAVTERTKAVIPVHLAGWPCDMEGIGALAARHAFAVIEDCAQAHGAKIGDRSVGTLGDIGAWSFCQDKIMTTGGEGGLVTTDSEALWDAMWSYKDHGKSWDSVYNKAHAPGFRWVHDSFGTNWRMLEMQAVIGRLQLKKMAEWTKRRTDNAMAIQGVLDRHSTIVRAPRPDRGVTHAYYRLYAYVRPDTLKAGWTRDRIVEEVNKHGVPLLHGSCSEVYLEKAFDNTAWRPAERFPIARELGETSLMFLIHPTLTPEEIAKTQDVVDQVLLAATA
jgi:dTDP-4-amino-4,6-dideoxygalactose transaminase